MNIVNDPLITKIAEKILDNKEFRDECKKNITDILKDGKVDTNDVPYILSLVIDIVNEIPNVHISQDKIVVVFRIVVLTILDDLNLLNDNNKDSIKRLLDSGLKLLTTHVKQKKYVSKLWTFLVKTCKCCVSGSDKTSELANVSIPNSIESSPTNRLNTPVNNQSNDVSLDNTIITDNVVVDI